MIRKRAEQNLCERLGLSITAARTLLTDLSHGSLAAERIVDGTWSDLSAADPDQKLVLAILRRIASFCQQWPVLGPRDVEWRPRTLIFRPETIVISAELGDHYAGDFVAWSWRGGTLRATRPAYLLDVVSHLESLGERGSVGNYAPRDLPANDPAE